LLYLLLREALINRIHLFERKWRKCKLMLV
jgi:hypothetical protein